MKEEVKIQSKEDHDRLIRKIWKWCLTAASLCGLVMLGTVIVMRYLGFDSKTIVNVQLIAVYIVVPVYGVGYIGPAFATSLLKMALGIEMNRRGLEIGEQTADHINRLQGELTPVIGDLKSAVKDAREIVSELREKELKKISEVFANGTFEKVLKALETIPGKLDDLAKKAEKKSVEDVIDKI